MSRIALAVAALLGATGLAVGQTTLSPCVYITSASSAAEKADEGVPLLSPVEDYGANSLSGLPQSPEGGDSQGVEAPRSEVLSNNLNLPPQIDIQPLMKPSCIAAAQPPSAGNFPALSLTPTGYRFWGGIENLGWLEKRESLPANLVTTGLLTDAVPGALGQPNTLGLSGSGNINFGPFLGVRLFAGVWLDPRQTIGLDASGFVLQDHSHSFGFNSTVGGNPLLALSHIDATDGAQAAFVIAAPAVSSGGIAVQTTSQLWGADANLLHAFYWSPSFRLVGLFGFRYLDLNEGLSIQTRKTAIDDATLSFLGQSFAAPAFELTDDRFHARSQFFGGQVGVRSEYYFSHFFVAASSKLAVGRTDEVMNALGVSTVQPGHGPAQSSAGGLFALPSNSGRTVNSDLGLVPEFQLTGGVLLTRWLRVTIGYDGLYWSRVLRAATPSI